MRSDSEPRALPLHTQTPISAAGEPAGGSALAAISASLALVALVILCAGLIRGRLSRGAACWGIALLPCIAFAFGHGFLVVEAKHTEFCASCHVMEPLVRSVVTGGAESLAALHVRRGAVDAQAACYACHRSYGVWGGWRAKLDGAEHILRSATASPGERLHLYRAYDARHCLDCHAQSSVFQAVPSHRSADPGSCAGVCHPPAHPDAVRRIGAGPA